MTPPIETPILTTEEACRWLRLDEDFAGDMARAEAALHRITARGELRALKGCGRRLRFLRAELERYATAATEKAESVMETDWKPASRTDGGRFQPNGQSGGQL